MRDDGLLLLQVLAQALAQSQALAWVAGAVAQVNACCADCVVFLLSNPPPKLPPVLSRHSFLPLFSCFFLPSLSSPAAKGRLRMACAGPMVSSATAGPLRPDVQLLEELPDFWQATKRNGEEDRYEITTAPALAFGCVKMT